MTAAEKTEHFKKEPALTDFRKRLVELRGPALPEGARARGSLTTPVCATAIAKELVYRLHAISYERNMRGGD